MEQNENIENQNENGEAHQHNLLDAEIGRRSRGRVRGRIFENERVLCPGTPEFRLFVKGGVYSPSGRPRDIIPAITLPSTCRIDGFLVLKELIRFAITPTMNSDPPFIWTEDEAIYFKPSTQARVSQFIILSSNNMEASIKSSWDGGGCRRGDFHVPLFVYLKNEAPAQPAVAIARATVANVQRAVNQIREFVEDNEAIDLQENGLAERVWAHDLARQRNLPAIDALPRNFAFRQAQGIDRIGNEQPSIGDEFRPVEARIGANGETFALYLNYTDLRRLLILPTIEVQQQILQDDEDLNSNLNMSDIEHEGQGRNG
jgi:hypothetical protein